MAWSQIDWLPNERAEFLLAELCCLQCSPARGQRRPRPVDFMPWREESRQEISDPREIQAAFAAVCRRG